MAQTKKRRRKKHRGTQAGTLSTSRDRKRPRSREEARSTARQRREQKLNQPPSWRRSSFRAGFAAVLFFLVVTLIGEPPPRAFFLSAIAFLFYLPVGYWTDRFMFRRHLRRKAQQASEKREDGK